jgi:hypothetical protein
MYTRNNIITIYIVATVKITVFSSKAANSVYKRAFGVITERFIKKGDNNGNSE